MSTRKLSNTQFEDSVVISGKDIQTFLDDATDKLNNISPDIDTSSWVQIQTSIGYTERRWDWDQTSIVGPTDVIREAPFMPGQDTTVTNPVDAIRTKGYTPLGLIVQPTFTSATAALNYGDNCYVWEASYWCQEPTILNDVQMHLQCDIDYDGTVDAFREGFLSDNWVWNTSTCPNEDLVSGDFVEDVTLQVIIDSPLDPQDPIQTSLEMNKTQFSTDSQFVNYSKDWDDDMLPSPSAIPGFPGIDVRVWGLNVGGSNLNLTIPARSRVRFILIIPDWTNSAAGNRWTELNSTSGYVSWPATPWRYQGYSLTINGLERRIIK